MITEKVKILIKGFPFKCIQRKGTVPRNKKAPHLRNSKIVMEKALMF